MPSHTSLRARHAAHTRTERPPTRTHPWRRGRRPQRAPQNTAPRPCGLTRARTHGITVASTSVARRGGSMPRSCRSFVPDLAFQSHTNPSSEPVHTCAHRHGTMLLLRHAGSSSGGGVVHSRLTKSQPGSATIAVTDVVGRAEVAAAAAAGAVEAPAGALGAAPCPGRVGLSTPPPPPTANAPMPATTTPSDGGDATVGPRTRRCGDIGSARPTMPSPATDRTGACPADAAAAAAAAAAWEGPMGSADPMRTDTFECGSTHTRAPDATSHTCTVPSVEPTATHCTRGAAASARHASAAAARAAC